MITSLSHRGSGGLSSLILARSQLVRSQQIEETSVVTFLPRAGTGRRAFICPSSSASCSRRWRVQAARLLHHNRGSPTSPRRRMGPLPSGRSRRPRLRKRERHWSRPICGSRNASTHGPRLAEGTSRQPRAGTPGGHGADRQAAKGPGIRRASEAGRRPGRPQSRASHHDGGPPLQQPEDTGVSESLRYTLFTAHGLHVLEGVARGGSHRAQESPSTSAIDRGEGLAEMVRRGVAA